MPQLERCFRGGRICFWGGQNFWVGLLFTKFAVDPPQKRKKGHRANLVYFSLSFLLISKKKVIAPIPKKKPPS